MYSSTSSSVNSKENNKDTPATPYEVQKRDILCSNSTRYLVMNFNGEGCFGKVATCVDLTTGNQVAVKVHKTEKCFVRQEIKMLESIRTLDPEKNNIVQFLEYFKFNSLSCMVFEKLDRSLWDLMEERSWVPLHLNEIRPVVYQLMVAFDALKGIGILHTDVKLDNIMLVNHKDQPFKIKLIDFGLARQVSKVHVGEMMQPYGYRAPEVSLGLPLSEAIDMWGVGCVMAFLYFSDHLFPGNCLYNSMRSMVHLLGQPADHMLNAAQYTLAYFCYDPSIAGWRLNSPDEYKEATGVQASVEYTMFDRAENLDDAVKTFTPIRDDIAHKDRMAFLSLLKACLELDPKRRVTPREAFKNPFLSMGHLADVMDFSLYTDEALEFMTVSPLNHLSESDYFLSDTDMDLSEMTYSSYGKSDCQAFDTDLEIEPSPAIPRERLTENSIAEDANMENNYDDDFKVEDWSSESEGRFSDIESCSCVDSHTDSYGADFKNKSEKSFDIESSIDGDPHTSGNYSDIERSFDDGHVQLTRTRCFANLCFTEEDDFGTVSNYPDSCSRVDSHTDSYGADIKNKSEKSFDIESSIDGDPHTSGNYSDIERSFDDGHVQLTRTRCFANLCFTEEDDFGTVSNYPDSCSRVDSHTDSYGADIKNKSEKSFDIESSIDGDPHTSGNYSDVERSFDDGHVQLTRTRCFANLCFTEEDDIGTVSIYPDSLPSSSDRRSPGFCREDFPSEIPSNGFLEGEIFIADVSSGLSAVSNYDERASATINPVTDCGPIASVDEASAAVGPTVGAAANPSNPGVEKKKKKTLFQRIRKFFSKLKARVI